MIIVGITGIVAVLIGFVVTLLVRDNARANKVIAGREAVELQMKADRQAHEQYMELQRLSLPEPSAELLAVRHEEARVKAARASVDKAATELAVQKERNTYRH